MEQPFQRVGLDPFHHAGEQIKPFSFIFDEGVFLTVATKPDAVSQMVHREQMVLPVVIDDLEHECLFQKPHQLRSQLRFFFRISFSNMGFEIFQ